MKLIIATALCFAALGAQAQANKCVGPGGKVQYSDTICPSGFTAGTVRTQQNTFERTEADLAKEADAKKLQGQERAKVQAEEQQAAKKKKNDEFVDGLLKSQKNYFDSLRRSADRDARSLDSLRR